MCTVIFNGFVAGISLACTVFPVGVVYANCEPFAMLPSILGYPSAANTVLGKVTRYLLCLHIVHSGVASFRSLFLTAIVGVVYRIEMLRALSSLPATEENIAIYRENAIIAKITYNFELISTRAGLTVLFVGIMLGVNIIIVAYEHGQFLLVALTATFTLVIFIILQLFFLFGCKLYTFSGRTLFSWKMEVNAGKHRQTRSWLKRVMKSLKVISMPAGDAGIIDVDIKVNYSENLLGYLADSIVTKNTLLNA